MNRIKTNSAPGGADATPANAMPGQDPLEQLRDIHLPDPVGWWPLAWGWWLAFAVLLIGLATGLWLWRRRQRRQRYRHQALAELKIAYDRYQTDRHTSAYLQHVSELLRRAALSALPAQQGQQVAARSGEAWLAFLDASLPASEAGAFSRGPGRALLAGPYQPNPQADVDAVHRLARQWLLHHRAAQALAGQAGAEQTTAEKEPRHA